MNLSHYPNTSNYSHDPSTPTVAMTPNTSTVPFTPALVLFLLPSTHPVPITPALTLFSLPQNSHCSHYPSILTVPISPTLTLCPLPQHSHCSRYPNTHTVSITITPALSLSHGTRAHHRWSPKCLAVPWPVPTFWHVLTIDIQYMVMCRLPDGLSQLRNLTHLGLNDVSLTRLPYDIARSVSALVHSIVASMHLLLKVAWFKCATLKMEQI